MDGPGSRNPRYGGLPNGPGQGLPASLRSRPPIPPTHASSTVNSQNPQTANSLSAKAEMFHDERDRIMKSLFAKLDSDGRGISPGPPYVF
jgi:hypothetical protein